MIITNYPMMMAGNQFKCGGGVWSHLFFWNCPSSGQGRSLCACIPLMCRVIREGGPEPPGVHF